MHVCMTSMTSRVERTDLDFKISVALLQRDCLKLATNGQSDKGFLLTTTFVPKGFAPALGLYTCIKALKFIPGLGVR